MTYATEDEALAAARACAKHEGFIKFDGMNCNELDEDMTDCLGWDGVSRRCDCGNRRVSWSTLQNKDGTWYAYAEAY